MAKWTVVALIGKSTDPNVPALLLLALTHTNYPMAMWLNDVFYKHTPIHGEYTETVTEKDYYEYLKELLLKDENIAKVMIIRGLEAENYLRAKENAKPYIDLINREPNLYITEAYEAFDEIIDPVNPCASEPKASVMLKKFIEILGSLE